MNFGVLARDQLRGLLAGQLRPLPGFYREFPNGMSAAFVHINKTGGTSIAQALGLPAKSHHTVREMQARLSEKRKLPYTLVFGVSFSGSPATNGPAGGAAGDGVWAPAEAAPARKVSTAVAVNQRRIDAPPKS